MGFGAMLEVNFLKKEYTSTRAREGFRVSGGGRGESERERASERASGRAGREGERAGGKEGAHTATGRTAGRRRD